MGILIGAAVNAANEANQPPPGQWGEHRNESVPPGNQLVDAGVSDASNDPTLTAWQNARQYNQPVTINVDSRVPREVRANIPRPGEQCWDLPGNLAGLPPGGKDGRSKGDLVKGLNDLRYNTSTVKWNEAPPPINSLPDGTVVIMGNSHTGVVKNGQLIDFTKPAPTAGVPAKVNARDSLEDLRNAKSKRFRNGQEQFDQPYKNLPMEIHKPPPGSGSASQPTSPPAGSWSKQP